MPDFGDWQSSALMLISMPVVLVLSVYFLYRGRRCKEAEAYACMDKGELGMRALRQATSAGDVKELKLLLAYGAPVEQLKREWDWNLVRGVDAPFC